MTGAGDIHWLREPYDAIYLPHLNFTPPSRDVVGLPAQPKCRALIERLSFQQIEFTNERLLRSRVTFRHSVVLPNLLPRVALASAQVALIGGAAELHSPTLLWPDRRRKIRLILSSFRQRFQAKAYRDADNQS
jgi:hypothetical protein